MDTLERRARAVGIRRLTREVHRDNLRMQRLKRRWLDPWPEGDQLPVHLQLWARHLGVL